MSAPVYACARCGQSPRADDTFLCASCLVSRDAKKEQRIAEATYPGEYREQRRHLIEVYHWAGWHRRLKGGSGVS